MKYTKSCLCFLLLSGFSITMLAQSTIPTTGGSASGPGGTASYSIGQLVYTTNTGTNGSLAQGVQQPYEISIATGIEEARDISLDIVVYPNPAADFIKLKIENYDVEYLRYQLYDISGNLLSDNKVNGNEAIIVMSNYPSGTYFLKVMDKKKAVKTFKVVKN
jgi:hypothetical protein